MAKIPLSSPEQRVIAQPQQDNFAPSSAFDTGARELGVVGGTLQQIGADEFQQARYQQQLAVVQARGQASTAIVDYENQVKDLKQTVSEEVASGRLDWRSAEEKFRTGSTLIDVPKIEGLAGTDAEHYQRSVSNIAADGQRQIGKVAFGGQVAQTKSIVTSLVDGLRKSAGMPDNDVDKVVARLDGAAGIGRIAMGDAWDKYAQDAKDGMYFDAATQQFNAKRDSLEALAALKTDLTSGPLSGKLDSNRRNELISKVEIRQGQLGAKLKQDTDAMDAVGARAIGEMQRQVETGIPASDDQMAAWAGQVKGTQYEPSMAVYAKEIADTQKLLLAPIASQRAEMQRQEAFLATNGGSPELQARVKRLGAAVEANVKSLQETPLLFAQNRTGVPAKSIDFGAIGSAGGIQQIGDTLKLRVATIVGLQKTYGAQQVAMAPLLPQEADMLGAVLTKSPDQQKLQLFGALAQALPGDAFAGLMQQVKADPPTTAAAFAVSRGLQTSLGNSVGEALLLGASVLKDKSAILPTIKGGPNSTESDALLPYFNEAVGDALPPGGAARDQYFQVFKAAYAGVGSHLGTLKAGMPDSTTARGALAIATGGVGEWGGRKVLKPWGMDDETFQTKVDGALRVGAASTDFTYDELRKMPLQPIDETHYRVLTGRKSIPTKAGRDFVIEVAPARTGTQLGIPR